MTDEKVKNELVTGDEVSVTLPKRGVLRFTFVGLANFQVNGEAGYWLYDPEKKQAIPINAKNILKKEKGVEMCSKNCQHNRSKKVAKHVASMPTSISKTVPVVKTGFSTVDKLFLAVIAALGLSLGTIYGAANSPIVQVILRTLTP